MEIIGKEIVWLGKFIRAFVLTYKDPSGATRQWEGVERVNCSGIVVIVPVTAEREVLLVRQFRPLFNNFVVELPAGLSDRGESLSEAARRELVEETGVTSNDFVFLAEGPLSSGISTEMLSVFLARDVFPSSKELRQRYPAEESEHIEMIKTPFSTMYDTLTRFQRNGDYVDLKIYGFVEMARRYLAL